MNAIEEFYKWVKVEETLPPRARRGRKPSKKQYFTYITQEAIVAYKHSTHLILLKKKVVILICVIKFIENILTIHLIS